VFSEIELSSKSLLTQRVFGPTSEALRSKCRNILGGIYRVTILTLTKLVENSFFQKEKCNSSGGWFFRCYPRSL